MGDRCWMSHVGFFKGIVRVHVADTGYPEPPIHAHAQVLQRALLRCTSLKLRCRCCLQWMWGVVVDSHCAVIAAHISSPAACRSFSPTAACSRTGWHGLSACFEAFLLPAFLPLPSSAFRFVPDMGPPLTGPHIAGPVCVVTVYVACLEGLAHWPMLHVWPWVCCGRQWYLLCP